MSEVNEQMPLEIWTDINGNATRTQFKGGVKYIRADERDRLRTRALTAVERWRAQTNVKEGISFRMAMKALEAALTPAGQRWTREGNT